MTNGINGEILDPKTELEDTITKLRDVRNEYADEVEKVALAETAILEAKSSLATEKAKVISSLKKEKAPDSLAESTATKETEVYQEGVFTAMKERIAAQKSLDKKHAEKEYLKEKYFFLMAILKGELDQWKMEKGGMQQVYGKNV